MRIIVNNTRRIFNPSSSNGENELAEQSLIKLPLFRFTTTLNKMTAVKVFLFIITISPIAFICFIQLSRNSYISITESLVEGAFDNDKDLRYLEVRKTKDRLSKDLKFILLWSYCKKHDPFIQLGEGQRAFIKNNCATNNCYVTYDKYFLGGDVTKFDAIAFNGAFINSLIKSKLPKKRSPHQKYIYFNIESPDNYPVCSSMFDGFFNWTATYKLNSDILFSYLQIKDRSGAIIGPRKNMKWAKKVTFENDFSIVLNKSKAVSWLVSNSNDKSGRHEIATNLQKYLQRYGLTVDIYGYCGPYKCPRELMNSCRNMLGRKYYFYLSLENSFAEDYVTEKLLIALNHNMIPIVYGGADYSRFLPPNTYLDALQMRPRELANTIVQLMTSPEQYVQYFWWKSQYTYSDPLTVDSVCAVCAALNNKTMMETRTVYDEFRIWWNPSYRIRCKSP